MKHKIEIIVTFKYQNKAKFNNAHNVLSTLVSLHLRVKHYMYSMDLSIIFILALLYFIILIRNLLKQNYLVYN